MEHDLFTLAALASAFFAGLVGSLTGLGGGAILAPILVLGLKVDIHYAIGAALLCSIATSTVVGFPLLKKGIANPRLALFFGSATIIGAIMGAWLSVITPPTVLYFLFGGALLISCIPFKNIEVGSYHQSTFVKHFQLQGNYLSSHGPVSYKCHLVGWGYSLLFGAGVLSGLLGIGSGVYNVIALEKIMGVPLRVALATSSLIVGFTTSGSVGIYMHWGYFNSSLVSTVVIGVLLGSYIGAKLFLKTKTTLLKTLFTIIVIAIAIEMIHSGFQRL